MNVLAFRQPVRAGWTTAEIGTLEAVFAPALGRGEATRWVVGETEEGDPQVYLLGPDPENDCILCVSRLGRRYIVEDGTGGLLSENGSLLLLAEQLRLALRRRTASVLARIGLLWAAGRNAEERVEPFVAEPMELFTQIVPLAMVA